MLSQELNPGLGTPSVAGNQVFPGARTDESGRPYSRSRPASAAAALADVGDLGMGTCVQSASAVMCCQVQCGCCSPPPGLKAVVPLWDFVSSSPAVAAFSIVCRDRDGDRDGVCCRHIVPNIPPPDALLMNAELRSAEALVDRDFFNNFDDDFDDDDV
jgi:hypothetical protein